MNEDEKRVNAEKVLDRIKEVYRQMSLADDYTGIVYDDYIKGGHENYALEKLRPMKHDLILLVELIAELETVFGKRTYHDTRTFIDYDKPFVRCVECQGTTEIQAKGYICFRCRAEREQ